ncbi:hypothetical protein [Sphingobium sp. RAC03]|jgi:hypothetical protein|uniref:hypothetical protein n=1 Tax=Sphingobium sp. RAC03 TaxID=1843368 RepID=UPI00083D98EC|nr:hypothetical protein [Sphingobium sp. RAC03]
MFQPDLFSTDDKETMDLPAVIERLAAISRRPRYTYMVLNLIAKAAGSTGRAGPYVQDAGRHIPLRDWLCDALVPMAQRDARRLTIVEAVRSDLERRHALPADEEAAARVIDQDVRARVRSSGRCNVSRAVSDLVRAGLVKRHYQGYRVDHHNRGAQREAVYTITHEARRALGRYS